MVTSNSSSSTSCYIDNRPSLCPKVIEQHWNDQSFLDRNGFHQMSQLTTVQMLMAAYNESGHAAVEELLDGKSKYITLTESQLSEIKREIPSRIQYIKDNGSPTSVSEASDYSVHWGWMDRARNSLIKTVEEVTNFGETLSRANQLSRETVSEYKEWHNSTDIDQPMVKFHNKLKDLSQVQSEVISQIPKVESIIPNVHIDNKLHSEITAWNGNIDKISTLPSGWLNKLPVGWNRRL